MRKFSFNRIFVVLLFVFFLGLVVTHRAVAQESSQDMRTCGPPTYPCSSTSTSNLGTLSALFSKSSSYNSTAFSPLNPSNDCITRITDSNTVNTAHKSSDATAFSQGNLTASGGDNDVMTSVTTKYVGLRANTGSTSIFHMDTSGACIQNITQGTGNPAIAVGGPFAFSLVTDSVFYFVQDNHLLQKATITSDTTYTLASDSHFPFDFDSCPGPVGSGNGVSGSILSVATGDSQFGIDISWTGGQGTAHMVLTYKPGTGCATLDLATGNRYAWCTSNCSKAKAAGTESVCTDPNYASKEGIHDSIMTRDGNVFQISGGCWNPLGSGNTAFWQINSNTVLGIGGGTSTWGESVNLSGHTSAGVTHWLATNEPSPNSRVLSPLSESDLSGFTTLNSLPLGASSSSGFHGGWPHPGGDDSNSWIIESANSSSYSNPTYLQNEIFAISQTPNAAIPRFGPTYSTATSKNFSCKYGIGFPSQDGHWWFYISDHLNKLGNDSKGKPLCSVFAVKLE